MVCDALVFKVKNKGKAVIVFTGLLELFLMSIQWSFNKEGSLQYMSRHMGKSTICIGKNKGADQVR